MGSWVRIRENLRYYVADTGISYGYIFNGNDGASMQDTDKFDASGNSWTSVADTPAPARERHAASAISGKAYIYCGYNAGSYYQDCDQYNPDGNSWASMTDAPAPTRHSLGASTISEKGYIFKGDGAAMIKDCDEFDASGNSWANKTSDTIAIRGIATSTIAGKGYCYCGREAVLYKGYCREYDPVGNAWAAKANTSARAYHSACTVSDKGYIFGGTDGTYRQWTTEYDNAGAGTWTNKTDMPVPARGLSVASELGDKAYLYCGYSPRLQDCDEYNPSTNSWSNMIDTPAPARMAPAGCSI